MYEKALEYYDSGEGCSRSILLAARDVYGIVSDDVIKSAGAITRGFGIGGFCSALIARIMVIGILYDGEEANMKRFLLMDSFKSRFCSVNCGCIMRGRSECSQVLEFICNSLDEIIKEKLSE